MANPVFGEAMFFAGDGRELTLRYDFAALAEAEDAADAPMQQILEELSTGKARLKFGRAMIFGGLRFHHPELTLADAGDLMLSDGEAVTKALGKAMEAMQAAQANPRKGAGATRSSSPGTGKRSSRPGARRG